MTLTILSILTPPLNYLGQSLKIQAFNSLSHNYLFALQLSQSTILLNVFWSKISYQSNPYRYLIFNKMNSSVSFTFLFLYSFSISSYVDNGFSNLSVFMILGIQQKILRLLTLKIMFLQKPFLLKYTQILDKFVILRSLNQVKDQSKEKPQLIQISIYTLSDTLKALFRPIIHIKIAKLENTTTMQYFDTEQDLKRSLIRRPSQRSVQNHGHSFKRVNHTPPPFQRAFFIIENKIYLFTDISNFQEIIIELNNISQSISRPLHINEFEITQNSLLRAKALGYTTKKVRDFLQRNMRNNSLPQNLSKLIEDYLGEGVCPKLYLVQEKNKNVYYFEISQRQMNIKSSLMEILKDYSTHMEEIQKPIGDDTQEISNNFNNTDIKNSQNFRRYHIKEYKHNALSEVMFQRSIPLSSEKLIKKSQLQQEMKTTTQLLKGIEALHCKDLKINLKAFTKLRDYQAEALKSVVSTKQKQGAIVAKSGYIVLPCGAGKTLLGISICCKIKKQTLIVCNNDSGCDQWKRQIEKWTQGIHRDNIIILTAKTMDNYSYDVRNKKSHIFISTYSNLKSKFDPKSGQITKTNQWLKKMPWGLVIFDQAQWLPAQETKSICNSILAHVKIGLTATPLRQDQNIKSLIYLIGPQLYVGSWKKFVQQGFLANPKCLEIRTSMTPTFRQFYRQAGQKNGTSRKLGKQLLYEANPNKIKALMYLLDYHESLNDSIIVFCDRIKLVKFLAQKLHRPLLAGQTSNEDRNFVFDMFRQGKFKTIFLTRIGDEAIDLPNANVGIEIAMNKGSRRQMMQRLGRIMRPKQASSSESYNAVFYTIVSDQTAEMKYFENRRDYLVNLGFQYDLRLFEYSNHQTIEDIYRSDLEKQKIIEEKFKKIIDDEWKYHQYLTEQNGQQNAQ